jgi:threonine dehydratase
MAEIWDTTVALADIHAARDRIAKEVIRTPLVFSEAASKRAGMPVYLKLESLQRTGTFKVRGALSKVTSLPPADRQRGMVCASSGNHGLGVAYASSRAGAPCVVVLPENANPHKMALLKELGAEIICDGPTSDLCLQKAEEIARREGYTLIHPFADPFTIAGQGTLGLEVLQDLPDVEEVYVPIGGGGLISGVAAAIKQQRPGARIFGVEPERANSMWMSLQQGKVVALDEVRTVADGLAAKVISPINLAHAQRYVESVMVVSDTAIVEAMFFLLEHAKVVAEPSAAASFAGLLANSARRGPAVAIISGGNVNLQQIDRLRQMLAS